MHIILKLGLGGGTYLYFKDLGSRDRHISVSSRPEWSTEGVLGQIELHSELCEHLSISSIVYVVLGHESK